MPLDQRLDDVRADRVIEHGRGADLHGAAAEQEVVERMRERRDAADARERAIGKRLRHLRHLGQRLRQNRRPAEAAARHEAVDVHLELERFRDRSAESTGTCSTTRSRRRRRETRRALRSTMSVVDGVSLAHTGTLRDFFHDLRDDGDLLLVLADVRPHVLAVHVRARQIQLERVGAFVLARLRERLPVRELVGRCPSPP